MNMKAMMAQAKKMQAEMEKGKAAIEKKEFEVEKQGAKVILFGNRRIKSIDVNESLVDPEDKDILEDLIKIAINEALEKIDEEHEKLNPQTNSGMTF